MKSTVLTVITLLIIAFISIMIFGCTFESYVFISFIWIEDPASEKPDSTFSCDAPNITDDIDNIDNGIYYMTLEGGPYKLDYSYLSSEAHSLTFTLTKDRALLGRENTYYDIYIYKSIDPVIVKYP